MRHDTHQPTKHHDSIRRQRDETLPSTSDDKPHLYSFAYSRHLLNMTRYCAGHPSLSLNDTMPQQNTQLSNQR